MDDRNIPSRVHTCDPRRLTRMYLLLLVVLTTAVVNTAHGRTTRSCNLDLYMHLEQFQRPSGQWVNASHRPGILIDAGNLVFSASAPGASHNLARKRASQKAEACRNSWWHRGNCGVAQSTSFGDNYGRISIRTLMDQTLCRNIISLGRADLLNVPLRGPLVGRINGDRCCYDSDRRCPYNYGAARAGSLYDGPYVGRQLWPGVTHYVTCSFP